MADDVEMIPVDATEPPKANPLASPKIATLKLNPVARKPIPGGATSALKPGLKLPPKPGMASGLKLPPKPGMASGLKLPPKPGMATGLNLPPKPGAGAPTGLKLPPKSGVPSGLKLPPKPGVAPGLKLPTVALKPGVKLPPKPVIRKPGSTVAAAPLPKPVAVDAQGVGKLPTVEAQAVDRNASAPDAGVTPNPMEALKTVTQKLKGITQEIPQQAILHKTGIIAEGAMSEAQKEAAKHKTARISLSDAMGVAPVKDENAPMKTIRIKRPIDIPGTPAPAPAAPAPVAVDPTPAASAPAAAEPAPTMTQSKTLKIARPTATQPAAAAAAPAAAASAPTMTQRKTLKIARPGGAVRPAGKFGVKRPTPALTAQKAPAAGAASAEAKAPEGEAPVADIADIPEMPSAAPVPTPSVAPANDVPSWVVTLSTLLQMAACGAIGALAWFLYENAQLPLYCGGLGWQ